MNHPNLQIVAQAVSNFPKRNEAITAARALVDGALVGFEPDLNAVAEEVEQTWRRHGPDRTWPQYNHRHREEYTQEAATAGLNAMLWPAATDWDMTAQFARGPHMSGLSLSEQEEAWRTTREMFDAARHVHAATRLEMILSRPKLANDDGINSLLREQGEALLARIRTDCAEIERRATF